MGIVIRRRTIGLGLGLTTNIAAVLFGACSDSYNGQVAHGGGGTTTSTSPPPSGTGGEILLKDTGTCDHVCSNDLQHVIDCEGKVVQDCLPEQGCASGECINNPCYAAELSKSSYGCDYWALKTVLGTEAKGACFVAFVANTWGKPIHIQVARDGQALPVDVIARIPHGQGSGITYTPYDASAGLGVGEVAVLFLSRLSKQAASPACPITGVLDAETGVIFSKTSNGTGFGKAFHITTDYPAVAYQMAPYGGAHTAVTSATLLLPTSAWDKNYIAINAYKSAEPDGYENGNPSLNIVAYKDGTQVTLLPKVAIVGDPGVADAGIPPVAPAPAQQPVTYTLHAGEFLQITQPEELTGSPIQSTEPVGVFGASACMVVPVGQADCDSAQQQIPPVRALGSEYVGVRYRARGGDVLGQAPADVPPWRIVGAVDKTTLTWQPSTPPGAPTSIGLGDVAEFMTAGPFTVKSQDSNHPFYLGAYMTGGGPRTSPSDPVGFNGEGDPDWINVITPAQYLNHYVFFTDPTYPETNLVVVRTPSQGDRAFADVTLQCAGGSAPLTLTGWQTIGAYEYTHVDLSTGNFEGQNGCTNGRQEMQSALPFGVTIWGWGHSAQQSGLVSYAYPAGAGFTPINTVVIPPIPN